MYFFEYLKKSPKHKAFKIEQGHLIEYIDGRPEGSYDFKISAKEFFPDLEYLVSASEQPEVGDWILQADPNTTALILMKNPIFREQYNTGLTE